MTRPVVLCVLDGVGERAQREGNAVALANTPVLDRLRADHPSTTLIASGPAVGEREGGTSSGAHGHVVLGAGRPVPRLRNRIDHAIDDDKLGMNEMVDQTLRICMYDKCPLHMFGLFSDTREHSSMSHVYALLELCDFHEIPVIIHAIIDGRDGKRRGAMKYFEKLEAIMDGRDAKIGTISGRYYAMDREEHWERTYTAFHAIVRDKTLGPAAPQSESVFDAMAHSYGQDIDDEYVRPIRIADYTGFNGDFMCEFSADNKPKWTWSGEDVGFAFNVRGDRMRQLSSMLTGYGLPARVVDDVLMDRDYPTRAFREHCYATMTSYGDELTVPVAFKRKQLEHTFGELLANAGLKQARISESVKAVHAGTHFSGHRHKPFDGEVRHVVSTPKLIDRYEEKPALSAAKVASAASERITSGDYAFTLVNLANADVLAHGGDLQATVEAVEAVDKALGWIVTASRKAGATLIVVGSHGNSETMHHEDGKPHTGHTGTPVPFVWTNDAPLRDSGSLADVAPTMLSLMGLEQPDAMTGRSLRADGD